MSVNAGLLATAVRVETLDTVGVAGVVTVKVRALDGALPGFRTVMDAVVGAGWEGSDAVSRLPLTKVVETAVPFQCTCEGWMKPEPSMVRLKPGALAVILVGLMEVMEGIGLVMVNVKILETDAVGLTMRTEAVPAVASELAGICAAS